MQQFEFQMGETNWRVKPDGFKPLRDQGERAVAEDFVGVGAADRSPVTAAQQGLHPHLKLFEVKGFGEVVVGSRVEATHLVLGATQGGQHQDWNGRRAVIAAQALTQRQSVHLGQHQIQKDQIRGVLEGQGLALNAVFGALHIKAVVLEVATHELAHVAVVFDQEDAGLHRIAGAVEEKKVKTGRRTSCVRILTRFVELLACSCSDLLLAVMPPKLK